MWVTVQFPYALELQNTIKKSKLSYKSSCDFSENVELENEKIAKFAKVPVWRFIPETKL